MKKEPKIKTLLGLNEESLLLDEKDKEGVKKVKSKKTSLSESDKQLSSDTKAVKIDGDEDTTPKDNKLEKSSENGDENSLLKDNEGSKESEEELTKKVWHNILIQIWNSHPNKNIQSNLKKTLEEVLKTAQWVKNRQKSSN